MAKKLSKRTETRVVKSAYLFAIWESILKMIGSPSYICHLSGYESDKDRVQFTYGGIKCILYYVGNVNWADGMFTIGVLATKDGVRDIWELPVDIRDFRVNTLQRIAYEVYDYCKKEDDKDWDEYERDLIAGWIDSN